MPVVKSTNGTVEFRRGAAKGWTKIKPGDKLKPEDTMRTGKGARAIVVVGNREIAIPEMVIVELSDFRELSQDEFLLRLAMEDVLRVPPRQQDTLLIPSTTILYGTEVAKSSALGAVPYELGELRLRGVRILFENKFYATSILRTKEVLRTFTDMRPGHAARFQMAQAFEKMNLYHEALREYVALSREQTPPALKPKIEEAIKRLKQ
jgi:hypothetical protein